jgi:hypothetical protein
MSLNVIEYMYKVEFQVELQAYHSPYKINKKYEIIKEMLEMKHTIYQLLFHNYSCKKYKKNI